MNGTSGSWAQEGGKDTSEFTTLLSCYVSLIYIYIYLYIANEYIGAQVSETLWHVRVFKLLPGGLQDFDGHWRLLAFLHWFS